MSALWVGITRAPTPSLEPAVRDDGARDADFVRFAAERNRAEVMTGELALQRATTWAIKQFAGRMVVEYARRCSQLNEIAFHKGIHFPAGLDPTDQASYDYLASLSGREFDQWYADHSMRRHTAALAEFQAEVAHGVQPEIK